jgi:two-component system, NtrC family, nitrogen regulation response regulator NtrX
MGRVLVVDDEEGLRSLLSNILTGEGHTVLTAEDGMAGLRLFERERFDLAILDVWLPEKGGIDVLEEIKSDGNDVPVIMISGHGTIDLAVKAVKLGAFDFLQKPLSIERVVTVVRNALEIRRLRTENLILKSRRQTEDPLVGSSTAIQKIRELIGQSAASDSRVLITGENGTGKELVAREIHAKSHRANRPFVEVNCAAIPDNLIESELFGHERGAFTGAVAGRRGKFELADGGTLFLDEIADMSAGAQAKVLRAVQEMRFERVGGEASITVDVRIIAATNWDISEAISQGQFREDLFFRLNVIPVFVPPLRERREDIPELVEYFLRKFSRPPGAPPKEMSPEGMAALKAYDWPGNIRELKNFVERVTILSDAAVVGVSLVESFLGDLPIPGHADFAEYRGLGLNEARELFERRFIEESLSEHNNDIRRAAEALGVHPNSLHGRLRKYRSR